jgi:enoyl-CoA hydratase
MDLILTSRGVQGDEALRMGLVRSHRLSAYEQWSLSYQDALRNELRRGVEVVESGETVDAATSFCRGQGRHGAS